VVIDAHSHWLPEEIINNAHFFSKAWGDIESHAAMMEASGIDKAVLSYPTSDAHLKLGGPAALARIYNDSVARVIKRFPDKFIGAAVLPVGESGAMADEFKRATQELGFKAVSLASSYDGTYLDDKMFLPVYSLAQEAKIPVFVHSQIINPVGYERVKDPLLTPVIEYVFDTTVSIGKLLMSGVLAEYADLKFIFAYFGGVTAFLGHRFDATYRMLRSINFVKDLKGDPTMYLKRIYVDTSGDTTMSNITAALEFLGPGHIMWGSDWPAKKDIKGSIDVINKLEITDKEKQGITGTNIIRILKGE